MTSCTLPPTTSCRLSPDTFTLAGRLKKQIPLSATHTDREGNTTCLYYDTIHGIIGKVWNRDGGSQIFSRASIFNGLTQRPLDDQTLARIKTSSTNNYILVCETGHKRISLWPRMVAAAKGDQVLKDAGFQDHHIFPQEIFGGNLTRWDEGTKKEISDLRAAFNHYGIEQECPDNYIPLPSKRTTDLPVDQQRNLPYQGSLHSGRHEDKYVLSMVTWAHRFLKENKDLSREQMREKFWATVKQTWHPEFKAGNIYLNQKGRVIAEQQKRALHQEMQEKTQQHGLTDSFNSCHPKNLMPAKPHTPPGEIGGVGMHAGEIENLFSDPEDLLENEHIIAVPCAEGNSTPPFSHVQLQQLLRELIIGIYDHDTVPFFSLDFNGDTNLTPLLHPAYENTLVGKVISLLDYFMKGYLNGGVFDEKFLLDWQKHKEKSDKELLNKIIDFKKYLEENQVSNLPYVSLRQLLISLQSEEEQEDLHSLDEDCLRMRSSFRIIAKQRSLQKCDNLFLIDPDFDVQYTLEPDPYFREKVRKTETTKGSEPTAIAKLKQAYQFMCHRIKEEMPKLPLCRELFSMLGVISFFSHYLTSLKTHGKIPLLDPTPVEPVTTVPLFPALPLRTIGHATFEVSFETLFHSLRHTQQLELLEWFKKEDDVPLPQTLLEALSNSMQQQAGEQFSRALKVACENPNYKPMFLKTTEDYLQILKPVLHPEVVGKNYNFFEGNPLIHYIKRVKKIKLPFQAEILTLASELKEKERQAIQNVVGGCGLHFTSLHSEPSSQAELLVNHNNLSIQSMPVADWKPLFINNQQIPSAFACSIPFGPIDEKGTLSYQEKSVTPEWLQAATYILHRQVDKLSAMDMPAADWLLLDQSGNSLLHLAATSGQYRTCDFLLTKGLTANMQNRHGQTPLHMACITDGLLNLKTLVQACPEVARKADSQGQTPLHLAVRHNNLACVNALFRTDASLDAKTNDGITPLLMAFHHEYWPIAEALIVRPNINLNLALANGQTPLHEAVASRKIDMVQLLLKQGAYHSPKRKDGCTPLLLAARLGEKEIVECLCTHRAYVTDTLPNKETALHMAIQGGCLAIVQQILTKAPQLLTTKNGAQRSALLHAILLGEQKIALHLIQRLKEAVDTSEGSHKGLLIATFNDPDDEGTTPIQAALEMKLNDVIHQLLDLNVTLPPAQQLVPILAALPTVDVFLEIDAKVHFSKEQKDQILILAPQYDNKELMGPLFPRLNEFSQNDFDTFFEDCVAYNLSEPAMIMAEYNEHLISEPYDKKGIHAFAAAHGATPLLEWALLNHPSEKASLLALEAACTNNHMACVELLLSHMRTPNISLDSSGTTPLHIAATHGHTELFEFLLKNGSSFQEKDRRGIHVLDLAILHSHKEIVTRLLRLRCPVTMQQLLQVTDLEILQQLLKSKVWEEKELSQACIHSIESSDIQKLQFLLAHGAKSDIESEDQWTPLTYAAAHGKTKELSLLIENCTTPFHFAKGQNALHHAIRGQHYQCIKTLLFNGFDLHIHDAQGKTAIDLANECNWLVQYVSNPLAFDARLREIQQGIGKLSPTELKELAHDLVEQDFFLSENGTYVPLFLAAISRLEHPEPSLLEQYVLAFGTNATISDLHGQNLSHLLAHKNLPPLPAFSPSSQDENGMSALHIYAAQEDPKPLQQAIKQTTSLDVQNLNGLTPLHLAILKGQTKNAEYLIEARCDINIKTKKGVTALWLAASQGDLYLTKKLVQHGARIRNIQPSALLTALENGHEEVAFFLARHGASLEDKDPQGRTAVHFAAAKGLLSFVRYLHEKNMSLLAHTKAGLLPMHVAAMSGQADTITLLGKIPGIQAKDIFQTTPIPQALAAESGLAAPLQAITSLNYDTEIPPDEKKSILSSAVRSGVPEQLERLLATPLGENFPSLAFAALTAIARDDIKAFERLHRQGICYDLPLIDGRNALHWACHFGSLQTALLMFNSGSTGNIPDQKGDLPIHIAVEHDHPTFLQQILARAPNGPSDDKKTLLHRAAAKGCYRNVAVLLDAGFSVHERDLLRNTPLHDACRTGNSTLIELLLLAGAEPEALTFDHKKANELIPPSSIHARSAWDKLVEKINKAPTKSRLLLAIEHGYKQYIPILERIYDINATDELGNTALHLAVLQKDHALLRKLLRRQADTEIKNSSGFSPLWVATCQVQDKESVRLLLLSKADRSTTNSHGTLLLDAAQELGTLNVLKQIP